MSDEAKFVDPSPKAQANRHMNGWLISYKNLIEGCPAGKSFQIELSAGKLQTIRSGVSRYGIGCGKKFRVVQHETCYEVYRKE